MIPTIGIMIGMYILTRCIEILSSPKPNAGQVR